MAAIDDILRIPGQDRLPTVPFASGNVTSETAAPEGQTVRPGQRMSYVDLYEALNPQKPETAEERAKREKREKGEAALSAAGDGISALANLFFTTRYAPNSFDASQGMSARARERWDRLKQEREANRRAYAEGYIRATAMDDANRREDRNWRHTLERERIADQRYEEQNAREKEMNRYQLSAAQSRAEQERIAAQYAEGTELLKQEGLRAGIRQKDAAAGASRASASASYSKGRYYDNGGSRRKGPSLRLGNEVQEFDNEQDYERTVMRLAHDYDVPITEVQVLQRDYDGKPRKERTVRRPVKDIAADIERKADERSREDFSSYEVKDSETEGEDFSQYQVGANVFEPYLKK